VIFNNIHSSSWSHHTQVRHSSNEVLWGTISVQQHQHLTNPDKERYVDGSIRHRCACRFLHLYRLNYMIRPPTYLRGENGQSDGNEEKNTRDHGDVLWLLLVALLQFRMGVNDQQTTCVSVVSLYGFEVSSACLCLTDGTPLTLLMIRRLGTQLYEDIVESGMLSKPLVCNRE
jgi:hypothetical protein